MRIVFNVMVFISLLGPAAAQSGDWQEVRSFDGRFRVLSPGPLTEKTDTMTTPVGELTYHTFFYQPEEEQKADNLIYMVSYCDYPEGALHSDSTELLQEFFDATIESARFSVKGDLIYESERKLRGYPGRFWRIHYLDGQAVIKTWGLVADNRYYSIQTVTLKNRGLNPSSDRFLDSFKVIRREGG